jgi:hypothetical protein
MHLIEASYEGYPGGAWRLGAVALGVLALVPVYLRGNRSPHACETVSNRDAGGGAEEE